MKSSKEVRLGRFFSIDEIDKMRHRVSRENIEIAEALADLDNNFNGLRFQIAKGNIERAILLACNIGACWMAILNLVEWAKGTGKRAHKVWDYAIEIHLSNPKLSRKEVCIDAMAKYEKLTGKKCPQSLESMLKHYKKQVKIGTIKA